MSKLEICEKEFELYINDVDKNNKMKLSAFLKYMQEVGALHSKSYGYGANNEPITHKAWIVLCWKIDILARPNWNEKIKVKTWLGKMDKIYYYRDFELYDSKGNIIAKAVSQWVMIDTQSKKIQKIDEKYLNEFVQVNVEGYDNTVKKINSKFESEKLKPLYECNIQKRDVDTNYHMNNIVYLDLAQEGLDDETCDNVEYIEIHYKTECKYNDKIMFMEEEVNDGKKIYILDENKENIHAVILLK